MQYNRFLIHLIVRICLICLNALLLAYLYIKTDFIITPITVFGILIFQTYKLIHFLNKTNRELANFILYIKEKDTSLRFSEAKVKKMFGAYIQNLDAVIKDYQASKVEHEFKNQYIHYIFEHIEIGLLAYRQSDGKVDFINEAAKKLLNINSLINIEQIEQINDNLYLYIKNSKPQQNKLLNLRLKSLFNNELCFDIRLLIKTSQFVVGNEEIRLISLQNIKPQLDEQEIESWQKLIRVLTHEIMNSITPITTLTTSLRRLFKKDNIIKTTNEIVDEMIYDTVESLEIIEDRGKGLIDFVQNYRNLTLLPTPKFEDLNIEKIISNIHTLMNENLLNNNIIWKQDISSLSNIVRADKKMLEQVLINLVKNAIEALITSEKKEIELRILKQTHQIVLQITDSGKGIIDSELDKIFVPFYTTKQSGSGVGLSLARQIMQLHEGSITVESQPGRTTFSLTFSNT